MTITLRESVKRRLELRNQLQSFTIDQVKHHNKPNDAYIVVDGYVYDITIHVLNHPGWTCGCAVSELMAILRNLGTDCTEEFFEVHSKKAIQMLQPYMTGILIPSTSTENGAG